MFWNNSFWSFFPICIYFLYAVDPTQVSAIFYLKLNIIPEAFFKDQFSGSSIFCHMDVIFCLITAPRLSWIFIFAPYFIIWNQSFYIVFYIVELSLFSFVILFGLRAERVIRELKASDFLFSCLFAFRGKVSMIGSAVRSGQFSTFPLLGSQLAVGRGFFPCFQINCTCGLAKLQAGFRFGSSLRSHSQLLNPLQTTGQRWLRLGTLNHLFLS